MSTTVAPIRSLDRIATQVNTALQAVTLADLILSMPPDEGRTALLHEHVKRAKENAGNALSGLQSEGGTVESLKAFSNPIPFDKYDTPASRRLLAALADVVAIAEEVDAERGQALPEASRLGPSDTLGIDLAEALNQIRTRVHAEVYGATGSGRE